MAAQGEPGSYAHPVRSLAPVIELDRLLNEGAVKAGSLADLRRSSVEAGGLKDTIRKFADEVSTLWGSRVTVAGEIRHEPPAPVALGAFQILQEGLVNALKHSRSDAISVRIDDGDGLIHIIVEDNGAGFDPEAHVSADHVGLHLMRERANRLGGRLDLVSAPGSGTRLEAVLPGGVAR
jgi:signal transduction histidine kinase